MWISPSSTRNYLLNDPIIDWLEKYYTLNVSGNITASFSNSSGVTTTTPRNSISTRDNIPLSKTKNSFISYIMNRGVEFEDSVYKMLLTKFGKDIVQISQGHYDSTNPIMVQATIDAMNAHTPIIYQGVLWDSSLKIRGVPDLLVRIDYLAKLFQICKTPDNIDVSRYNHLYVIVDIKLSKLSLACNGIHILNSGSIPAYKGQLYLYNYMLGKLQGIEPSTSYILGRGTEYTSKGTTFTEGLFQRAGCIDYDTFDNSYIARSFDAVNWLKRLNEHGSKWSINPPSVPELYPNMCNTMDSEWNSVKKKIAYDIGEITSVWFCGVAQRELCHDLGIMSWRDSRLDSKILGFKNERARIVDLMLTFNRSPSHKDVLIGDTIKDSKACIMIDSDYIELYIDFETINSFIADSTVGSMPEPTVESVDSTMIFMIGVGFDSTVTNITLPEHTVLKMQENWAFRTFTLHALEPFHEKTMIDVFVKWIKDIEMLNGKTCRLYHWADAERSQFISVIKRHSSKDWDIIQPRLFDLCKLFKEIPILVKGVFGFGLKDIGAAMYKLGMIDTTWDGSIMDGMSAMLEAKKAYDQCKKVEQLFINTPQCESITFYNNLDCKIMFKVLKYIRSIVMNGYDTVSVNNVSVQDCTKYKKTDENIETVQPRYNLRKRKPSITIESESAETVSTNEESESKDTQDSFIVSDSESVDVPYVIDLARKNVKVKISEILNARLSDKELLEAYNLYRDGRYMKKYSSEYIDCMTSIRKILEDSVKHSNATSRTLQENYLSTVTDIDTIMNSGVGDNLKLLCIGLLKERDEHEKMSVDYIRTENKIVDLLRIDEYSIDQLLVKIHTSDMPYKDVLYGWYRNIKDNSDPQTFINKIQFALSIPFKHTIRTYELEHTQLQKATDTRSDACSETQTGKTNKKLEYLLNYKKLLDENLYGMDNVKSRFIQYINLKLKQVLALQGHPGMGKTAICKAHAKAIDRPIYFINVGSCTDIDSLKGCNSVWSGSEPGQLSKALAAMKVLDGIIVLDEIDKIDMRDNRSNKIYNLLLQILDPIQNSHFEDEYIPGIYLDLSGISFICTFNNIENIDPILLDRLTVIKCKDYSKDDISIILRKHMIPKICGEYNMDPSLTECIGITDEAISLIRTNVKSDSMREYEKSIHRCISWIKIVYDIFGYSIKSVVDTDSEQLDLFYNLMGEEYKNFPIFKNGYYIDVDLVRCITVKKDTYNPMYL